MVTKGQLFEKLVQVHCLTRLHRKKIGEFLHDIRAIDAIKITEPSFVMPLTTI